MAIARFFEESKWDGTIPQVGLADIDEAEWETLPKHVQASVDELPYFRRSKPTTETRRARPELASEPASNAKEGVTSN